MGIEDAIRQAQADIERYQAELRAAGGWQIVHAASGEPMIRAPNGRVFAIRELTATGLRVPIDAEMSVTLWCRALAERDKALDAHRREL